VTKRCLVTGGAGFIGSNLAAGLEKRGWDTKIVDNLSSGDKDNIPEGLKDHLLVRDFCSKDVLDLVKNRSYDVIFHLAANPRVPYSVEHPAETNFDNVQKTLVLLEACVGNVDRIVFASSAAVYGKSERLPTKEEDKKLPESPYGLQKLFVEEYLRMLWKLRGLDSACLRFFNVFGNNQLGGSPYSTAVSAWLTAVKSGKSMRSDGDGTQTRDMCHVDNVVEACILAAEAPGPLKGEAFNVACGESFSNRQILEKIKEKYPFSDHFDAPWRQGDIMHTLADISKSVQKLGYRPVTDFWTGLDKTIDWYERNWNKLSLK